MAAAGLCETRVAYRSEANGNPRLINSAWLAAQVCTVKPLDQQFCWFDPDTNNMYFVFRGGSGDEVVGVSPDTLRKFLIDESDAYLIDGIGAQLFEETIDE